MISQLHLLFYIFFFSFLLPAKCWWEEGHMLVAQIAFDNLDDMDIKDCAQNLIRAWASVYPESPEFITSSVWADDIKNQGMSMFNELHYISIPLIKDNITPPTLPEQNVVWAISGEISSLRSSRNRAVGRALQLRLLIHFLGDLHNPMHAVTLYSDNFPNGDRGGNSFQIYDPENNRLQNLHAFWDSGAGDYAADIERPLTAEGMELLTSITTDLQGRFPKSHFGDLIQTGSVQDWADQSHDLAVRFAYNNGTLVPGQNLTSEYIQTAKAIIQERITLGGYRLAYVLQQNLYLTEDCLHPVDPLCPTVITESTQEPLIPGKKGDGLSGGAVAGISIALFVVGLICGGVLVWAFMFWKKKKDETYNPL